MNINEQPKPESWQALKSQCYRTIGFLQGMSDDLERIAPDTAECCRDFAKSLDAAIERSHVAQPQPSKASSPLGERSWSPWVGKSERRFIEQKKRSEQYDENALVAKLKPLLDQPPSNPCPLSYSHLPHDYCDGKPTARAIGALAKATDGNRQICTPEHPMPKYAEGRWRHTNAHEVHDSQQDGWPSGDTIRVRCDDCGYEWTEELPQ